jgi:drug/metabolite transporter (DMT)-like permease
MGTSLCYGVGSVLQSAAAAEVDRVQRLEPRLLLALARTWRYVAGLALDGVGFVLSLVALRTLPLYVVQSVVSSSLAVTAVLGVLLLGLTMRGPEIAGLVVVVLGLALVGLSAAAQPARPLAAHAQWLLLAAAAAVVLACLPLARLSGGRSVWLLGSASGLAFGVVAVAARAVAGSVDGVRLTDDVSAVASSPATYAALVATPLALIAYATALQRGTVVQATAPLVVGETVLPALAGLALLGDHPRPGWGAAAGLGFVLAVGGSVLLSRFGDVEPAERGDAARTPGKSSG